MNSFKPLTMDSRCWDCGAELRLESCLSIKGPQTQFRIYRFCGYKCALAWLAVQYTAWQHVRQERAKQEV